MTHIPQSKPRSQSDTEPWFQKNNYMSRFLSEDSKRIINKIKQKNMNKILYILLLLPIFAIGQSNVNEALKFQNTLRTYYYADPLSIDPNLSLSANNFANELLLSDSLYTQNDDFAEAVFSIENNDLPANYNPYLDASIAWAIDTDDFITLDNMLSSDYSFVGFGVAKSTTKIIVVAKFR